MYELLFFVKENKTNTAHNKAFKKAFIQNLLQWKK